MRLLQFSLRSLLVATVLIALGCAALLNATPVCASLVLSATLGVLVVAILGSIYRTGRTRAFWLGMAIVGWAYLWLARQPDDSLRPLSDPRARFLEQGPLVTTLLLQQAYIDVLRLLRPPPPPSEFVIEGSYAMVRVAPQSYPTQTDFITVGHSLWALLLGFLGGLLARWFYATRQTRSIP